MSAKEVSDQLVEQVSRDLRERHGLERRGRSAARCPAGERPAACPTGREHRIRRALHRPASRDVRPARQVAAASFGGVDTYPTLIEQTAVLLEHLARIIHALRRVAFLLMARFLDANGVDWAGMTSTRTPGWSSAGDYSRLTRNLEYASALFKDPLPKLR